MALPFYKGDIIQIVNLSVRGNHVDNFPGITVDGYHISAGQIVVSYFLSNSGIRNLRITNIVIRTSDGDGPIYLEHAVGPQSIAGLVTLQVIDDNFISCTWKQYQGVSIPRLRHINGRIKTCISFVHQNIRGVNEHICHSAGCDFFQD